MKRYLNTTFQSKHFLFYSFWLSILLLAFVCIVFSFVLYYAESIDNQSFGYFDALVWTFARSMDDPAGVASPPITPFGMAVGTFVGVLGIVVFAIPVGLISSAYTEKLDKMKKENNLKETEKKLKKAFRKKQCRYTKLRTVPVYLPVTTIQAKQQMDTKDIIEAVEKSDCFRLRNLADAQNCREHPNDRLVVEMFEYNTEDDPYGCLIDKKSYGCLIDMKSNVTIVSTSSVHEAGIGNFAYYLAKLCEFNFVSKEIEKDKDNPVSFYIVNDPNDEASNTKQFIDDIKRLSPDENHWTIFLLSASGAEEPVYKTSFHFIYGAEKGDDGYTDPNLTIMDTQKFDTLYQDLSSKLEKEYGYKSDKHKYHSGSGEKNIARRIEGGKTTNAFTIRIAFKVTVWDDRHIAIARTMAETIKKHLSKMDT